MNAIIIIIYDVAGDSSVSLPGTGMSLTVILFQYVAAQVEFESNI